MKRYETDHILWHCRLEEIAGIVLATAGIAIIWGAALHIAADFPTQHSGTQTLERIK